MKSQSWFTTVVDGTELWPVDPVQLKQYSISEDDWVRGAKMAFIKGLGKPKQDHNRMRKV